MTDIVIVFLDVGQGDCTIVVDKTNRLAAVVDCPGGRSTEALEALRGLGVARLTLALVSHNDWDHLGGMYETVNSTGVDEVRINLAAVVSAGDETERIKLKSALRAFAGLEDRGVSLQPCYIQDAGQFGDIRWRALWPTHGRLLLASGRGDPNIGSVILKLEIANASVLIGGDAPAGAFLRAKSAGEDLTADVFRLSHHGGRIDQLRGPTIGELLDEVGARYNIVSVGTINQYGHPSVETLEALGQRADRARVLCTQVNQTCAGGSALPRAVAESLPQESLRGAGGRPEACRCAGSISIYINDDGLTVIPNPIDHGRVIDTLDHPMCRLVCSAGAQYRG